MKTLKPIAITIGEPAGIGPELVAKLVQEKWSMPLVVIGDGKSLPLALPPYVADALHKPGEVYLLDIPAPERVMPGHLNVANAPAVVQMLQRAVEGALTKEFAAIVTGPVHKGIINQAGIKFSGHTEFFAHASGIDKPVMMLMNPAAKVVLITTHLPIRDVAQHITSENIIATISILHMALVTQFNIKNPRIGVCGLNPHAGEGGHLGREEIDIIIPSLDTLRRKGLDLIGPLPADTAFLPAHLEKFDAIVAMYHDQGLPVVKQIDFAHTVNVTLGLPFVRTSVDHGTALELAGKGVADVSSFREALKVAIELAMSTV